MPLPAELQEPGPPEPVKRNTRGIPRPAPLRDIARQVRHSAPLARAAPSGKVTHTDALNRRVATSRTGRYRFRSPEPAHSGAPGFSHVQGSDPPWSRTPPANFAVLNRPVGTPDRDPGGDPISRANAVQARGHPRPEPEGTSRFSTPDPTDRIFYTWHFLFSCAAARPGMGYGGARFSGYGS